MVFLPLTCFHSLSGAFSDDDAAVVVVVVGQGGGCTFLPGHTFTCAQKLHKTNNMAYVPQLPQASACHGIRYWVFPQMPVLLVSPAAPYLLWRSQIY